MKYEIQWYDGKKQNVRRDMAQEGSSLLDFCVAHGLAVEAACNGKGLCGKCAVQIVRGDVPVTEKDRQVFSERELAAGWRLACLVKIKAPLLLASAREAVTEIQTPQIKPAQENAAGNAPKSGRCQPVCASYSIAADLGSTTLAAVLLDGQGTVVARQTAVNSQRRYGADVIARMQASMNGQREALQNAVCGDLLQMFERLLADSGAGRVGKIAIAGNTVMLHLLRAYPCETLARAPFVPINLGQECLDFSEVFSGHSGGDIQQKLFGSKVYLLPGLSAFVGADITAGLFGSGFLEQPAEECALFVDLGTNAEMVLGSRAGFVSGSAAAGPALEGGSLSCGVPGIPGAVFDVQFLYHRVRVQTIGQKPPCGVCGTGALAAVAALLDEGLLDEEGLLAPQLFTDGFVLAATADGGRLVLTQADIREIQMAKAAIRAGLDTLLLRYREHYKKTADWAGPDRIYLAGGFGYYLPAQTAVKTGLFPKEWLDKITVCGNASLHGAIRFLAEPSNAPYIEGLREKNIPLQLAQDAYFKDAYIANMRFPTESR